MPISIVCSCGKKLKAPDNLAGKRVKCPACGALMQAPAAAAAPVPAAPAAPPDLSSLIDEQLQQPAAPMSCPNCRLTLMPGSTRCLRCGFDLQTGQVTSSPQPGARSAKKKASKRGAGDTSRWEQAQSFVVAGGAIVLMVAIVYFGVGWVRSSWARSHSRSAADALLKHHPPSATLLSERGADALPALIEDLTGSDEGPKVRVAYILGLMGAPAVPAVSPLIKKLKTASDASVRVAAATALGQIGSSAPEVIPELGEALKAPQVEVRVAAVQALGKFGPEAKPAVPLLVPLLSVTDNDLCLAAAESLGGIDAGAEPAVPALLKAMSSSHPGMPAAALKAVGRIATKDPAVFAALESGLKNEHLLLPAAESLAAAGPAGRSLVPALFDSLSLAEAIVQKRLWAIQQRRDNQPVYTNRTYNAAGEVTSESSYGGPGMGGPVSTPSTEPSAVHLALRRVADGDLAPVVQAYADRRLPELLQAVQSKDELVRASAVAALGQWPDVRAVIPALRDKQPAVRVAAATALGRLGHHHAEAVKALIAALGDEDAAVRSAAMQSLRRIGGFAVEYLLPALKEDPALRESIEQLLKELPPQRTP